MNKNFSISFIVPALNEEMVLTKYLNDALDIIGRTIDDYEIILINDGSTDKTGELMTSIALKFPNVYVLHNKKNIGLGNCYKLGISNSTKEYTMLLCGDGGLPVKSLPPIFSKIGQADIVIPWMQNLKEIKSPSRYLLSRAYTNLLNKIFSLNLNYYNGLSVHKTSNLKSLQISSGGFGFQAEILIKSLKSGSSYVEAPVWGAEEKGSSFALRPRNWISVSKTIFRLIFEVNFK